MTAVEWLVELLLGGEWRLWAPQVALMGCPMLLSVIVVERLVAS